jgi:isopropylmalate/homocitrate/citramalate synthase
MTDISGYASPYNWESQYVTQSKKPSRVMFHDLTLEGDGEEMAGVTISEPNKVELAKRLADIGIPRLSILGNSPRPSERDIRVAETIASLDLAPKLGSFVKTEEEIRLTARIGLDCVSILVWVNDTLLPPDVDGQQIIEKSRRCTTLAKELGLHTTFMAMDAARTRVEFLEEVIRAVEPTCDEFAIADSVGVASPFGFRCLVEHVGAWTSKPIQVHCHNHSSMAVANALGAVLGGASILHTTVNGLGEFAGLLALEEVAVALSMHLGVESGIQMEKLTELSAFVAEITGVKNQLHRPVVGDHAFCVPETEEIQQALYELAKIGVLNDSLTFPPELVGNRFRMAIGRRCNEFTVRYHLWVKGFQTDSETVTTIVAAVRHEAGDGDGYYQMTEQRFMQLVGEGEYEIRPLDSTVE